MVYTVECSEHVRAESRGYNNSTLVERDAIDHGHVLPELLVRLEGRVRVPGGDIVGTEGVEQGGVILVTDARALYHVP